MDETTENPDDEIMTPPIVPGSSPSLPPPPPPAPPSHRGDSPRVLRTAVPLLTVSWLVLAAVAVASLVRIDRWELAPGEAMRVSPRITFEGTDGAAAPERFENPSGISFVTAFGGRLSALDAVLGGLDEWVDVQTYEEHFGDLSPSERRRLGYQAMVGSKQIAEYVAAKRLGLDAELVQGAVIVEEVLCDGAPAVAPACEVLELGDTIVEIDGTATPTLAELADAMKDREVGESLVMKVLPKGVDDRAKAETRTVTLMEDPDEPGRALIGIVPADTRTVKLPFEVGISTADIGGPSAGLAFTVALLDELTEGNLVGRGRVAATGTIDEDGTVGAIGALPQKAVAVRDAGATLFLVPASQSDEEIALARRAAGAKVKIVPVADLDAALDALRANGGDQIRRP